MERPQPSQGVTKAMSCSPQRDGQALWLRTALCHGDGEVEQVLN